MSMSIVSHSRNDQ